mmetsp:Transcript_58827/g.65885  ORF Transcript_58827/g.65885 Transcript_58827/m.65885 type:complete len:543 (-) Transcript_58827:80-1708(-)
MFNTMMDFEDAAVRLAHDQSKMRSRKRVVVISDRAKKQAEYQKKVQKRLRAEREQKKRTEAYQRRYLHDCQRLLKEKSLASNNQDLESSLFLKPTSIFGDGDKIAFPPTILEKLTSPAFSSSSNDDSVSGVDGNPWTFRIGILNPNYKFPSSPLVQALEAPIYEDDDNSDDEEEQRLEPFLQELDHRYLMYTHCTVVEFTQEEGHVGIPTRIAQALLDPKNRHEETTSRVIIPTTITVDPASPNITTSIISSEGLKEDGTKIDDVANKEEDRTAGHLAWGAFEIPDQKLEITMVQLPKGTGCTLVPTKEAVRNNFYGLKDVKLVLEQSLIRTRATLSIGDVVSTWFRGIKFDLNVTKVLPSTFVAVTCINTDIEVEIGENKTAFAKEESNNVTNVQSRAANDEEGYRLGTGRKSSSLLQEKDEKAGLSRTSNVLPISLLPEPPLGQKYGVCNVQIRYSGGNGKRRFAIDTAKVKDLFAFVSSLVKQDDRSFRLVTRFPRREISLLESNVSVSNSNRSQTMVELTLNQIGIEQGQEMFIVEDL